MRLITFMAAIVVVGCGNSNVTPPDPDGSVDTGVGTDAPGTTDASDGEASAPNDDAPFAAQRAACAFKQGALPKDTFGPSIANMVIPIDTIVIVSQENRSFDEYFSRLPQYGQTDVDVPPSTVALTGGDGGMYSPFHQTDYCFADTNHDWDSMHADWDNGKNDGFVKVNEPNGARTLGWFDQTDISFYYDMAGAYGVGDAYFSALLGPTGPNRLYLYAGTSYGHVANGPGVPQTQPSIFQRLKSASVVFKVYSAGTGPNPTCPGPYAFETSMFCDDIPQGSVALTQFDSDAAAGKLPPVSWIYPGSDEHPAADMQVGESNVQHVFNTLAASPQWSHAAFILVYDEGGGAYDHAPPPSACLPDAIAPAIPGEASTPGKFDRYGFRVPFVVASPYSKPHHVSHVVQSHTSILRFLELVFKMPACSDRDANAEPLIDFFDFSTPSFTTPHVPANVVVANPTTKGC
jgi:phospholipase C